MKQIFIAIVASLLLAVGGKETRVLVLTPTPQMHCANCENKIKGNLRFEKGVSKIETSIDQQTVVFTYDPAKTDVATIQKAMKKIGYDTKVLSDKAVADKKTKKTVARKVEPTKGE